MAGGENKSSLSSNVLQMKFMKRSALRIEKEKSEEEKQHIIDDIHWVLDLPALEQKENKFIVERSYERCEDLVYGRMSFKGFNPEVEKLMTAKNIERGLNEAEYRESENSLNEKEMAERYQSLVGTISNKFKAKRDRQHIDSPESSSIPSTQLATLKVKNNTKKKFKKPPDC